LCLAGLLAPLPALPLRLPAGRLRLPLLAALPLARMLKRLLHWWGMRTLRHLAMRDQLEP
jgi:hypothetical protein